MNFSYSRRGLAKGEWWLERLLEIFPAFLSWSILIGLVVLCFVAPITGVVAVILFDLYWLFRLIYLTTLLVISYGLLEIERSAKWRDRLEDLVDLDRGISRTKEKIGELKAQGLRTLKKRVSERMHLRTLERLKENPIQFPNPDGLFHLIVIPFYREGVTVLEMTIQALTAANYPLQQMVIVLGAEERAGEEARELGEYLKRTYGKHFFHFEVCLHPDKVPGEAAVKGANATHAAKRAKKFFESKQIAIERVIVSCFDCDTVISPEYFSCLTYNFLIHPDRTRTSFQPIPVYHNNIWEAPLFARVVETGSSFLQLIEVTYPEKLVTFSSHSMSFQALVEIGYWPMDLISDDSAIFWKALLAFDGDYRVQPLYVTLSMNVAIGKNLWETFQSIYLQKRRWAWGVENFPILVRGLIRNREISFLAKLRHSLRLLELNVSWATWTLIVLLLSWVPAFVANREFTASVAHFNAPRITAVIFNLALTSLLVTIILSFFLLPKRTKRVSFFQKFFFVLQWLLVPITANLFGAIPALDAQTRLAFGRYLEFFVAPKGEDRKKETGSTVIFQKT